MAKSKRFGQHVFDLIQAAKPAILDTGALAAGTALLIGASAAQAHTTRLCWSDENGQTTLYAGTYHSMSDSQAPVGSIIIDGVAYPFTGQIPKADLPEGLTCWSCNDTAEQGVLRYQTFTGTFDFGSHQVTTDSTSVIQEPYCSFPTQEFGSYSCEDTDSDGVCDEEDVCPLDELDDSDADGYCANVDNCPEQPNPEQTDSDADGLGDTCDPDDDNDTVLDESDLCPATPEGGDVDSDGCTYSQLCEYLEAHAPGYISDAGEFNILAFGHYYNGKDEDLQLIPANSVQVEGPIAARGIVTLTDFNVGYGMLSENALIAGAKLNLAHGTLGGNAVFGTTLIAADESVSFSAGELQQGAVVDFSAMQEGLRIFSRQLHSLHATAATQLTLGGIRLVGSNNGLNVFEIGRTDLESASNLSIEAPAGSTVVVNLSGAEINLEQLQMTLTGVTEENVLINVHSGGTLNVNGVAVRGSILAPRALVNFSNGSLVGTLVARGVMSQQVQFRYVPFAGSIAECPVAYLPAVQSCEVAFSIVNSWLTSTGVEYQADVTFTHEGEPLSDWLLQCRFGGDDEVKNLWNGSYVQKEGQSTINVFSQEWNGSVQPGQAVSVGFIGSASALNSLVAAKLDGVTCEID